MCPDDSVRIPLRARDGSIRAYAIVDAGDAEWASQRGWYLTAGYASHAVGTGKGRRTIFLHREILGLTPGDGFDGDHINRDKLDNRRRNLRKVTRAMGHQNLPAQARGTSRFRGVGWLERLGKWRARVTVSGEDYHLGLFDTEAEAAEAARTARERLMPYAVD